MQKLEKKQIFIVMQLFDVCTSIHVRYVRVSIEAEG